MYINFSRENPENLSIGFDKYSVSHKLFDVLLYKKFVFAACSNIMNIEIKIFYNIWYICIFIYNKCHGHVLKYICTRGTCIKELGIYINKSMIL